MAFYPEIIENQTVLEEQLSKPGDELVELFRNLEGDIIILGIAGKIGPSLSRMALNATERAGVKKKIFGVSRFSNENERLSLEKSGIITFKGDLLDQEFISTLPRVKNVFFLAGMKFGSEVNPGLTWAINSFMPGLICNHFRDSRIVAYSTGCVYPLVPVLTGGSRESDSPLPVGEYAQSCLGRERLFEFASSSYNTPVILIRLNYAVEVRYGVLADIAYKVKNRIPVDLSMGFFNVIWQGDANEMVLRSILHTNCPAETLNITSPEICSTREIAKGFGKLLGVEPVFIGLEQETALLSNPSKAIKLFGNPRVPLNVIMKWVGYWIDNDKSLLGKPTHFEIRDGKY